MQVFMLPYCKSLSPSARISVIRRNQHTDFITLNILKYYENLLLGLKVIKTRDFQFYFNFNCQITITGEAVNNQSITMKACITVNPDMNPRYIDTNTGLDLDPDKEILKLCHKLEEFIIYIALIIMQNICHERFT